MIQTYLHIHIKHIKHIKHIYYAKKAKSTHTRHIRHTCALRHLFDDIHDSLHDNSYKFLYVLIRSYQFFMNKHDKGVNA